MGDIHNFIKGLMPNSIHFADSIWHQSLYMILKVIVYHLNPRHHPHHGHHPRRDHHPRCGHHHYRGPRHSHCPIQ